MFGCNADCSDAFASRLAPTGIFIAYALIVPTLCVGMQPGTLCVPTRAGTRSVPRGIPTQSVETIIKGPLLRQLQIIKHPIHRQFAEHDQLRNPHQRSALGWLDQSGEFLGDGFR